MLLSLDISTSCVGYAVFSEKGALLEMNYVKFSSKKTIFEKLDQFKEKIAHLSEFDITAIAIEEPLKKFQGKYSSANTIAILNFFNGMVSGFVASHFKLEPVYYNVNFVRSKAFPDLKIKKQGASSKHQVWECVLNLEPQINWKYGVRSRKLVEENYDMADAYAVGKCYLIMMKIQKAKLNS